MKKIIFVILLSSFAFANTALDGIFSEIKQINSQLLVIKNNDANATVNNKLELDTAKKKKSDLMIKIPSLIINTNVDVKKITNKVKKLKSKISANEKAGFKNAFMRDKIALDMLYTTNIFYSSLEKLKKVSKKSIVKQELQGVIGEALFALKAVNRTKTIKNSGVKNDYLFSELEKDELNFRATLDTYIDVLSYLNKNLDQIQSNYFFSKLDIDYIISYIDSYFVGSFVSVGKVFICILVFGIFWFISKILRRRKFTIFILPSKKMHYNEETKKAIICSTNRPFLSLLFIFSLKVCANIAFHPYGLSPNVNIAFNVAYIACIAWLINGILYGYSIAFLNSFSSDELSFRKDVVNLILKILYFVVAIIAFLLILSTIGVDVSAIIASLGIGGLAVAWASKDILANFFSSILLLIDNSFAQGDWIECGDTNGIVVEVGLRHTTIRTFDNALLFVPNIKLANEPIRNWSRRRVGRRIKMSIGLTYDTPREKLEQCVEQIRAMLLAHPDIADPEDKSLSKKDKKLSYRQQVVCMHDLKGYKRTLMVHFNEFSASSMDIIVYCFSKSPVWQEWIATKEDVMYKIMDIVEGLGLSFAFPSQSIYIEDMPKQISQNKEEK